MSEGVDYREIFMPEAKCSRCGDEEPVLERLCQFPEGYFVLGFCSEHCVSLFVRGSDGVKSSGVM